MHIVPHQVEQSVPPEAACLPEISGDVAGSGVGLSAASCPASSSTAVCRWGASGEPCETLLAFETAANSAAFSSVAAAALPGATLLAPPSCSRHGRENLAPWPSAAQECAPLC